MDENEVSRHIVDSAMEVHTKLGPGLLESAYSACLRYELCQRSLMVAAELSLPVVYEGVRIDAGYRIDLLVNNLVIIEVKAVERLAPIHDAQLLSYLRLSGKKLGLILNFNVLHMRDGIRRLVNNL